MTLPAGYYRIDPDIRALVAAMNVHGFRTYASCQGHGFPVTKLPPYIAFVCPVKKAALLEQRLRQDAESMMTFLLAGCGSNQVTTENTGSSDYRPDRGLPYIISLLVLAVSSKKSRAPKAEGIPYDKGQR